MSSLDNKELIGEYLQALSGQDKPPSLIEKYVADAVLREHIALAEAEKAILRAFQLNPQNSSAQLDKTDQALQRFRMLCDVRCSILVWLKIDPTFDSLRNQSRYAELLHDLGLERE